MGDLFSKSDKKTTVNVDKNKPSDFVTLNFGDGKNLSELAMKEKFDNTGKLPNYTKNPELNLEELVLKLKGEGQDFRKDVSVVPQKPQPIQFQQNDPTIPKEFLKNHLDDLNKKVAEPLMMQNNKMNCRFLNSSKCHPDYPNFSGASINFPEGSKMKCDSIGPENMAKAVCSISKGKITGIYMIDEGKGYGSAPKVEAIGGGGEGSNLEALVVDGRVKEIKVRDGGDGYHETPVIKIENPNLSNGCYLCCK